MKRLRDMAKDGPIHGRHGRDLVHRLPHRAGHGLFGVRQNEEFAARGEGALDVVRVDPHRPGEGLPGVGLDDADPVVRPSGPGQGPPNLLGGSPAFEMQPPRLAYRLGPGRVGQHEHESLRAAGATLEPGA